jgi:hypothetical protein
VEMSADCSAMSSRSSKGRMGGWHFFCSDMALGGEWAVLLPPLVFNYLCTCRPGGNSDHPHSRSLKNGAWALLRSCSSSSMTAQSSCGTQAVKPNLSTSHCTTAGWS